MAFVGTKPGDDGSAILIDNVRVVAVPRPRVRLTTLTNSQIVLSWPGWASAFYLCNSSDLSAPVPWQRVGSTPNKINGILNLTVPAAGLGGLFEALEPCLIGRRETQPYAVLAAQLGMTEAAVKMAVYRLRDRYRECLREEIAHTVASPTEVEEELRHLFRVLARR